MFQVWSKPHYLISEWDKIVMGLQVVLGMALVCGVLLGGAWLSDRWTDWKRDRRRRKELAKSDPDDDDKPQHPFHLT